MKIDGDQELLRVHINEEDQWQGQSLSKAIVERARREGLAGCTLLRAIVGFGQSRDVHDVRSEYSFSNLPVVIEMVDGAKKIDSFLLILDEMMDEGMVTREKLDVEIYQA